jgi:hypothetical protein
LDTACEVHPLQSGTAWVGEGTEGLGISSFHKFVREGKYGVMWGADTSLEFEDGFE